MRRAALILTVTEAAMLWASTALAQTAPEGNLEANCQADWTRVARALWCPARYRRPDKGQARQLLGMRGAHEKVKA
jgi:hypothetical protein